MFTHSRSTPILIMLSLLCVSSGLAIGADNRPIDQNIPILTPDDPNSTATIVGPWGEPMQVRVVTVSDVSVTSLLYDGGRDPAAPARIATAIVAPSGELLNINIVEIGRRVLDVSDRRDPRRSAQWVVNTDLPFTARAAIEAALNGTNIKQPRPASSEWTSDAECYITGEPVLEIFVWYNSTGDSPRVPNYAIKIVPPGGPPANEANSTGGGDLGGGGGDGDGGGDPPGDGADPIGSPDRRPQLH